MAKNSLQKYDCDRSGFTHRKCDLKRQRGLLVAPDEFDDLSKIEDPKPRWGSPRENSDTTTAGSTPTVFTITAANGIDSLQQSQEFREDGVHINYFMHVIGESAPTDIVANPQIIAGQDKEQVTLYGTSDTNYLLLEDGDGLSLIGGVSMKLKNTDVITLVYTSADTTWRETSRQKGGF